MKYFLCLSFGLFRWIIRNDTFVDQKVFAKIRERLGGRVKLMITGNISTIYYFKCRFCYITLGSAPLSSEVLNFTRCVLGCVVVEGYGQTECIAACTVCFLFFDIDTNFLDYNRRRQFCRTRWNAYTL